MRAPTHMLGGVLVAALLPHASIAGLAAAGLGALLPDVDHPRSTLGRMLPGSGLLYWTVGHRTVTHGLAALGLLWALTRGLPAPVHAGLVAGFVSHLMLDALSGGVPLLWPVGSRLRLPSVPEWLAAPALAFGTVLVWRGGGVV